jgi:hypothetical protein
MKPAHSCAVKPAASAMKPATSSAIGGAGEVRLRNGREAQQSDREEARGRSEVAANSERRPGDAGAAGNDALHLETLLYVRCQQDGLSKRALRWEHGPALAG